MTPKIAALHSVLFRTKARDGSHLCISNKWTFLWSESCDCKIVAWVGVSQTRRKQWQLEYKDTSLIVIFKDIWLMSWRFQEAAVAAIKPVSVLLRGRALWSSGLSHLQHQHPLSEFLIGILASRFQIQLSANVPEPTLSLHHPYGTPRWSRFTEHLFLV